MTVHQSTGRTHYLMFEREPHLPIDFVLGIEAGEEGESSVEEWVKEHQELLEGLMIVLVGI